MPCLSPPLGSSLGLFLVLPSRLGGCLMELNFDGVRLRTLLYFFSLIFEETLKSLAPLFLDPLKWHDGHNC